MKIYEKIILYTTALLVIGMAIYGVRNSVTCPDVAYVDIGRLVENYKFKKDLEAASSQNLYAIKAVVDSLELVKKVSPSPEIDAQLSQAGKAFEQYYTLANNDINKKIWDRLNPLIEKYGQERQLEILIGANGTGTVLYGSKPLNKTDDLIGYINSKYENGN